MKNTKSLDIKSGGVECILNGSLIKILKKIAVTNKERCFSYGKNPNDFGDILCVKIFVNYN